MTRFNMPEDIPLEHPLVSKSIENAQVKVEGFNFDTRKHLVEYDDVLNKQREIIYRLRKQGLETAADKEHGSLKQEIEKRINHAIETLVSLAVAQAVQSDPLGLNEKIV